MAAGVRARRKAERPGEILEAALAEFVQKGYAATRLEDVAARVGVTLKAVPGSWAPTATLGYQWFADGVAIRVMAVAPYSPRNTRPDAHTCHP